MEQSFEREVLDRLKTIEIKLDGYGDVKAKVYENERKILLHESEIKDIRQDFEKQQEETRWLKRTVIAAIITGLIGILVAFLRVGIGV
ncbi:MAG: hemolysin XhlA family protein [Phascolarctobacterium sp.]|nr:hemolysin XhlA family protein [Candidatus Phascolarctobacterium caballi]